jgi:acyl-CoA oxidase
MVTVRAWMAEITGWDLLKAVIVAYNYTKFRKQFKKGSSAQQETTVFDYASVRCRILPLLAQVNLSRFHSLFGMIN